jgi:hypothetical protein
MGENLVDQRELIVLEGNLLGLGAEEPMLQRLDAELEQAFFGIPLPTRLSQQSERLLQARGG